MCTLPCILWSYIDSGIQQHLHYSQNQGLALAVPQSLRKVKYLKDLVRVHLYS